MSASDTPAQKDKPLNLKTAAELLGQIENRKSLAASPDSMSAGDYLKHIEANTPGETPEEKASVWAALDDAFRRGERSLRATRVLRGRELVLCLSAAKHGEKEALRKKIAAKWGRKPRMAENYEKAWKAIDKYPAIPSEILDYPLTEIPTRVTQWVVNDPRWNDSEPKEDPKKVSAGKSKTGRKKKAPRISIPLRSQFYNAVQKAVREYGAKVEGKLKDEFVEFLEADLLATLGFVVFDKPLHADELNRYADRLQPHVAKLLQLPEVLKVLRDALEDEEEVRDAA